MPFPIPIPRLRRLLTVSAAALLVSCALPALASACNLSSDTGSQVFARYGDYNDYVLAPNGIFAGGSTSGWSLLNATLTSGGPGLVSGDGQSVVIGAGGTLTSPVMCIGTTAPTVRFMARQPAGSSAVLYTYVLWTDWAGNSYDTYIGWVGGTTSWQPVYPLNVASLPLWEPGQTLSIRVQLVPAAGTTNWQVDDFFIDPYAKG
jgi:hypothetical protein